MPLFDFPEKFFRDSVLRVLCKEKVKRYCLLGHAMNKKNIKKKSVAGDDTCAWRTNYKLFSLPARRYIYCHSG